jgi:hypothetical protein
MNQTAGAQQPATAPVAGQKEDYGDKGKTPPRLNSIS